MRLIRFVIALVFAGSIITFMLKRLYADNFRCFVNLESRFEAKQLILGPNGAGKSTLFDCLAGLRDVCIVGQSLKGRFVGSTNTRWQDVPEQTFELDVSGNEGQYTFRFVVDSWGSAGLPRVVREEVDFSGIPIFRFNTGEVRLYNDKLDGTAYVHYPFDWHRSALATITERKDNTKLCWFKRWLGGLLCVSPDPRQMSALAQTESASPASDLSNFADWYRHLRLENDDRALLEDLREAVEGFETMDLKDAGLGHRVLKVSLTSKDGQGAAVKKDPYDFKELSDGQRVLIGLYTLLHFALRPGATICFDEPDNFIALREIQPWLSSVLDRVEDEASESQVLIVSHHPELLNRLAFQDGLLFDRPGGRHVRVRRFDDPSNTGLSAAELIARGWERE